MDRILEDIVESAGYYEEGMPIGDIEDSNADILLIWKDEKE